MLHAELFAGTGELVTSGAAGWLGLGSDEVVVVVLLGSAELGHGMSGVLGQCLLIVGANVKARLTLADVGVVREVERVGSVRLVAFTEGDPLLHGPVAVLSQEDHLVDLQATGCRVG